MLNQNFVIIGALIGTAGAIAYLTDTIKGKVKPNRVSFLLWAIAPMIAFAAQMKQGVGLESLMTFTTGFLPLIIFIASFTNKNAEWKLTRFDLACGFLSVLGLIVWLITKVGNVAIFLASWLMVWLHYQHWLRLINILKRKLHGPGWQLALALL